MKVDGKCHCGKIAFEAEVDPNAVAICHCTDCQTLTGSVYRANVMAPAAGFKLLSGEPRVYIKKTAASGNPRAHAFCPDCGTPIYATAVSNPQTYALRIGTIRQRAALGRPFRQIWCRSAMPWSMDIQSVPKNDQQ